MTALDVLKIVTGVLLSIGGGGTIVLLFSGWLGKVWANRLMEEDRAKHAKAIEELRSRLEAMNRRIQSELDKTMHVHQVQFQTEFKALSEIWGKVMELRSQRIELTSCLEVLRQKDAPTADREHMFTTRFEDFSRVLADLKRAVYEASPFYPKEIYDRALQIVEIGMQEERDLRQRGPDYGCLDFAAAEITERADRLAELIRARIESLAVYRE